MKFMKRCVTLLAASALVGCATSQTVHIQAIGSSRIQNVVDDMKTPGERLCSLSKLTTGHRERHTCVGDEAMRQRPDRLRYQVSQTRGAHDLGKHSRRRDRGGTDADRRHDHHIGRRKRRPHGVEHPRTRSRGGHASKPFLRLCRKGEREVGAHRRLSYQPPGRAHKGRRGRQPCLLQDEAEIERRQHLQACRQHREYRGGKSVTGPRTPSRDGVGRDEEHNR